MAIFQVPSLPKTMKNQRRNAFKKSIEKKRPRNRFLPPFWLPKPPQNAPKIEKNAPEALSKTSQKKQAPEPTDQGRKAPGPQAFWDPAKPSNHLSND